MKNLIEQKHEIIEGLVEYTKKGEFDKAIPDSNIFVDNDFLEDIDIDLKEMQKYLFEVHDLIVDHITTTSRKNDKVEMLEIFNDNNRKVSRINLVESFLGDGIWVLLMHENVDDAIKYVEYVINYLYYLKKKAKQSRNEITITVPTKEEWDEYYVDKFNELNKKIPELLKCMKDDINKIENNSCKSNLNGLLFLLDLEVSQILMLYDILLEAYGKSLAENKKYKKAIEKLGD